mmetsp:Transcript_2024/g.4256  ORF Transcript_2024/g.4256 Transcript_2024/m.4256 type:complete len:173 (+) Transcript_2024:2-520(+)
MDERCFPMTVEQETMDAGGADTEETGIAAYWWGTLNKISLVVHKTIGELVRLVPTLETKQRNLEEQLRAAQNEISQLKAGQEDFHRRLETLVFDAVKTAANEVTQEIQQNAQQSAVGSDTLEAVATSGPTPVGQGSASADRAAASGLGLVDRPLETLPANPPPTSYGRPAPP